MEVLVHGCFFDTIFIFSNFIFIFDFVITVKPPHSGHPL